MRRSSDILPENQILRQIRLKYELTEIDAIFPPCHRPREHKTIRI